MKWLAWNRIFPGFHRKLPGQLGCGWDRTIVWPLLLVAGFLATAAHSQIPTGVFEVQFTDSLSLSLVGRSTGITWIGPDTLAVLDDIPDSLSADNHRSVHLVLQDRSGNVLLDQDFTGVLDRALTWDGEFLWGCGDNREGGSLLYKIKLDSLLVDEAYDLPGHRPTGMCFDGRYLWISDRDSGRIDRFDPVAEAVTRSVIGPAFSPVGLAWGGRHTWLTDAGTGLIYRLTGGRRNWTGTVSAESFYHRGQDILLLDDGFSLFYVPAGEHFAVKVVFPR